MVDIGQDLAARARFDPKAAERAKPGLGQQPTSYLPLPGVRRKLAGSIGSERLRKLTPRSDLGDERNFARFQPLQ